jgi:hypothetical protein
MRRRHSVTVLAVLLAASSASAQRVRLDDSLSPIDSLEVNLQWETSAAELAANALAATTDAAAARGQIAGVEVRLDTTEYVGAEARIYLSLPQPAGDFTDIELRWQANGSFLSGSVRPGQSTLVFEGVIEQAITSAVFDFELLVSDSAGSEQNRIEAIYELEPIP